MLMMMLLLLLLLQGRRRCHRAIAQPVQHFRHRVAVVNEPLHVAAQINLASHRRALNLVLKARQCVSNLLHHKIAFELVISAHNKQVVLVLVLNAVRERTKCAVGGRARQTLHQRAHLGLHKACPFAIKLATRARHDANVHDIGVHILVPVVELLPPVLVLQRLHQFVVDAHVRLKNVLVRKQLLPINADGRIVSTRHHALALIVVVVVATRIVVVDMRQFVRTVQLVQDDILRRLNHVVRTVQLWLRRSQNAHFFGKRGALTMMIVVGGTVEWAMAMLRIQMSVEFAIDSDTSTAVVGASIRVEKMSNELHTVGVRMLNADFGRHDRPRNAAQIAHHVRVNGPLSRPKLDNAQCLLEHARIANQTFDGLRRTRTIQTVQRVCIRLDIVA
mmetsp:Transcript_35109/g.57370  ORF Transcript_35109/g.57370 Transcript_35109/m.57370 type:complete len:390 (-) Transcript_35109:718-1887(-)